MIGSVDGITAGPAGASAVDAVDWRWLRAEAARVAACAYAPYSRLHVGAAAVVDDGRLVVGCNVENASYGLTLCAECVLVGALHTAGGGRLVAFVCVTGTGAPVLPCGRCRQLLYEHGGPDLLVATAGGPRRLADLLPDAFGPADLPSADLPPPAARATSTGADTGRDAGAGQDDGDFR
ncbi:cytidine deaminase [Candidatus Protofrankia datiscae]|uniref:Cytidine deaminase n=1 Tax=Candidatus Protofrankia datiscae TaxID=2716812 RepID=F8AY07_9ACTN|nr:MULTISPECIES: cytidine deaminase [Protofrankia]AEH08506.1 cytidine deaminase [Candidatus Protofrankia datiscae]